MISVRNVTKHFRSARVLNGVSVEFADGQISGIAGRNGSGKTVLLKCIIGLLRPDEGDIVVSGRRIGKDVDFAQDVGFIVNRPGFLPDLSGFQNLRYLASIRRKIGKEEIRSAIRQVGLDPSERKHVGKYSMGMRQRLGIAQALMENPSTLILDEPMNGLDIEGVVQMRALLLSLKRQGRTLIITSHDSRDIDALCDCVWHMDRGTILPMHRADASI